MQQEKGSFYFSSLFLCRIRDNKFPYPDLGYGFRYEKFLDPDPGYGIRYEKFSVPDPGSVINIPDPQHRFKHRDGKIVGFYDGWHGGRTFQVDMAGFAVNLHTLRKVSRGHIFT
jgi:hypothetical protein